MSKSFSSILWIMTEKFGSVFISTITFLIYSMYLSPAELGVATIALSIGLGLSQTIIVLFQDPIVVKKRLTKHDISSCFVFNIIAAILVYFLVVLASYLILGITVNFHLIAVACLAIPIASLSSIYIGVLRRLQRFKSLALRTLICRVIGAIVGASLVIYGAGPLSMIAQVIFIELFSLFGMIVAVKLKPRAFLSLKIVKELGSQGLALATRKLSWEACVKGSPLLLAAFTTPAQVGLFAFAWRLVDMPRTAIHSGAMSFMLPKLVQANMSEGGLRKAYIRANKITMMIICPLFIGLAVCAEPLLFLVFGNKWNEAILLLQILACLTVFNSMRLYVPTLFTSLRVPKVALKTDVFSSVITLIIVALSAEYLGALSVVIALFIRTTINFPISLVKVKEFVGLPYMKQFTMFGYQFSATFLMLIPIFMFHQFTEFSGLYLLCSQVLTGGLVYLLSTYMFDKNFLLAILDKGPHEQA